MDSYKLIAITVTSIGSLLAVINSTSLLISLPTIMISLHTTFFYVIWILVVYPLVMTIGAPLFGRYSDFVGRNRLYALGYLFFISGSAVAAVSPDAPLLLVARVLQGLGGALLFSNSLAIIADAFRQDELKWAIGTNSLVIGIATAIGPLVGGLLTAINWRYVFVFNVPFGIVGYVMSLKLREIERRRVSINWKPAVFFSIFIVFIVVYLTFAPPDLWLNPVDVIFLVVSVVSLIVFILMSRGRDDSLIDISLFRLRPFATQSIATFLNSITRYSALLIVIIMLQGPLGISPLRSSIIVIPYAVSLSLSSYLVGNINTRRMESHLIYAGLFLSFFGSIVLSLVRSVNVPFYIGLVMVGFGIGLFYTPSNAILMSSAPPDRRGSAAGIRTVILNLGSVIGMSMVFTIVALYVPETALSSAFLGIKIPGFEAVKSGFLNGISITFLVSGAASLLALFTVLSEKLMENHQ
ncbi:MFS transporter [Thermoplasma sp.]|uniref:MFS transporter n=1 Tax=Thermoplasma sp. TaxID=1973142 RepID=UPI00128A18DF|nr:MFS transporter [Thermoplasma sp.]KAA8923502.1 MAG: MFS transporter [Thermoplasma sp.]